MVSEPVEHLLLEVVGLVDRIHRVSGRPFVFEVGESIPETGHDLPAHVRGGHRLRNKTFLGHQTADPRPQDIFYVGARCIRGGDENFRFPVDSLCHRGAKLIVDEHRHDAAEQEDDAGRSDSKSCFGRQSLHWAVLEIRHIFMHRNSTVVGYRSRSRAPRASSNTRSSAGEIR